MAGSAQAPVGADLQVGARFCRQRFVPGGTFTIFPHVKSISGYVAARPRERTANLDPSNQTLLGRNVAAKLDSIKIEREPDVDSLVAFRAHHVGAYAIGAQLGGASGPYPWTFEPGGSAAAYVDSMDLEVNDGDGYPIALFEASQQDLEVKIQDGKIITIAENWMACFDTYLSEASDIISASYTAVPSALGHLSAAADVAANLPIFCKVTSAAATGNNGKVKFAQSAAGTGTIETDGTTTIVGSGTSFLSYAVGDVIHIDGETPRLFATIASDTSATVSTACSTTATGKAFTVAEFLGVEIPVVFDKYLRVTPRVGISRFDDVWVIFPSGEGTLSVGDLFSFTKPRTAATASYSDRGLLSAAGVEVVIDGETFGGVPGYAGFHGVTIKITRPRKVNTTTGSKYAQGVQRNGPWSATISFDRDRTDRVLLEKLIRASTISVTVSMYGDPFADSGYDELWQFAFTKCEIAADQRDVSTPGVLPEKIDVNAVRDPATGNAIFTETIYSSLSALP